MPYPKHLGILGEGVQAWNEWRYGNNSPVPNLTLVSLVGRDLTGINFEGAQLTGANLRGCNLNSANLVAANLRGANLMGANLHRIDGRRADFLDADLPDAYLSLANLQYVDFSRAVLTGADFTDASIGLTRFALNDLSSCRELETIRHDGPSTLGLDVLAQSRGRIPEPFLRGCGFADWELKLSKLYQPSLSSADAQQILYDIFDLRASQPIQINTLFISYSHADTEFVDELENLLDEKGIRFWRDIHDSTSGRLEKQLDQAIRLNPIVLVVLSKDSVQSDWVEHEVRLGRKLEKEIKRDVLCPIALDTNWKSSDWPERIREQIQEYNILDFSKWQDPMELKKMFSRLISGIKLFYEPH